LELSCLLAYLAQNTIAYKAIYSRQMDNIEFMER